ncbi:MAG TPA: phospholipase D-like domain-containing protein, partial [Ktedonobacterales bacterium]|nr:phospholipase D-like domain-containing protein [Ktedonobacterales bacterium]
GGIFYRPVYTHAKVAIVDDVWWTAGSANLNSRGMRSDAEINLSVADATGARNLRSLLWTEHLGRAAHDVQGLEDPVAGLQHLRELAEANRERVRRRQPIVGHILPYLTAADGARLQLPVHEEHGWLDNLEGGSGALARHHAGRYL